MPYALYSARESTLESSIIELERVLNRVRKDLDLLSWDEIKMLSLELEEVANRCDHLCQQAEDEAELVSQERYWDTEMEKARILEG